MIKKKYIYIALAFFLILSIAATTIIMLLPQGESVDVVELNRLAGNLGDNWDDALNGRFTVESSVPVSVVSLSGDTLSGEAIGGSYLEAMNRAAIAGYPVFDIVSSGNIVGKLIAIVNNDEYIGELRRTTIITVTIMYISLAIIIAGYLVYLELIVFRPFKRMSKYAAFIANGELDIPLEMDRGNIFGAYTESFNTMRLHLKAAKLAESKARRDKEDFILEINHDMLSPLSVIKAAAQNISLKCEDNHVALIEEKAEELESILNDLMTANLQDNGEYKMYIDEISSDKLVSILKMCDYKRRIESISIERCLVKCDELRTAQIFGNIISNSYKYADTRIDVTGTAENGKLVLTIRDYGLTLNPSEIDRLTERYFRGSNAVASNGAGLGLHIVETCQRMQGGDVYFKYDNGLSVILVFSLT